MFSNLIIHISHLAQLLPPGVPFSGTLPGSPGDMLGAHGVEPSLVTPVLNKDLLSGDIDIEALPEFIIYVINFLLSFTGVVAFILFVLGGFYYLTAAGNEEQTKKAHKIMLYAIIGIVIILVSYSITTLITKELPKL